MTKTILTVIAFALVLSACSGDNSRRRFNTASSSFRIVNLVTDSPSAVANVNGSEISAISFGQSTELVRLSPGNWFLDVFYSEPGSTEFKFLLSSDELRLTENDQVNVFLVGTIANLRIFPILGTQVPTVADGAAYIEVFNGTDQSAAYDVYLSDDPTLDSLNGISPVALAGGAMSDGIETAAGEYRLFLTLPGSDAIIYDTGAFTLRADARVVIALHDHHGPGGVTSASLLGPRGATRFVDERFPAALRIANLAPGAAVIDVLVDGTLLFEDVGYGTVSGYLELDRGEHTVTATLADQPAEILFMQSRTLVAGEPRTLALAGDATGPLEGRFFQDAARRIGSGARIRSINAATNQAGTSVYLLAPDELLTSATPFLSLQTLMTATEVLVPTGDYSVFLTDLNDVDTIVASPADVTLGAGDVYSLFVFDADPADTLPARALLINDTPAP